jgi:formylglycine-generating enzyme required for sulfatase activity
VAALADGSTGRAGPFVYGERRKKRKLPAFFITRFPVTHCQFQCFVDDPDSFRDPCWWEGLAQRCEQPADTWRVERGGSWYANRDTARFTGRLGNEPTYGLSIGFGWFLSPTTVDLPVTGTHGGFQL